MKNKISKKLVGGLIIAAILVTIGAVLVSADTDDSGENKDWYFPFWGSRSMSGRLPFFSELTDDQKEGIKELKETKEAEGATPEEIREAIRVQLGLYGIEVPTMDERLDNAIANTELRLQVLERVKKLREDNPEYTWKEIRDIIQEEFELESPTVEGQGMMFRHGFRCGPCRGPCGLMSGEESDL